MATPGISLLPYTFMIKMLEKKKKFLTVAEAPEVFCRKYRELKLSNLLAAVLPSEEIQAYLPDKRSQRY